MTFSIEVEPLVDTLPESSVVVCAAGASSLVVELPAHAAILIIIAPAKIAANTFL